MSAPPQCTPDMGATILSEHLGSDRTDDPSSPPGWQPLDADEPFDWNEDGQPDRLIIDDAIGTVTVDWGSDRIVVSDVRSRFGWEDPVSDAETGTVYVLDPPYTARVATVGDVTGDGRTDLLVAQGGTVAVIAGSGQASTGMLLDFEQVGRETPGWVSPPLDYESIVGTTVKVPFPIAEPALVWDLNGDGAVDFRAFGRAGPSRAPQAYYLGRRCTTEQP